MPRKDDRILAVPSMLKVRSAVHNAETYDLGRYVGMKGTTQIYLTAARAKKERTAKARVAAPKLSLRAIRRCESLG